jgi:hypothetical protein
MARDKIEIEVLAKGVKKAQKDVDGLKKSIDKTGQTTEAAGESMVSTFAAVAAGAFAAFQTIKKGLDLANEFARFQQGAKAMESQFGVSANKIIQSLGAVAKGTISNADLIESANRAMALNVTKDVGEMAKLLEVARVRGQAMGLDTNQAFSDLVTGIGRGSPLILDNLGIITKGWADEAKAAGGAMDAQFILNKVLADGADILKKTGDVALTNAERFQQWTAQAENAKLVIGKELLPLIFEVEAGFKKFSKSVLGDDVSGMSAIVRVTRTLVAGLKIVALQFTTVGKIAVITLTPLIKLIQTLASAKDAFDKLRDGGKGAFEAIKEIGKGFAEETIDSLKKQLKGIGDEYAGTFDSIKNIFGDIDALLEESEIKRQQREQQQIADKTLLQQTLEQIEAESQKRLEGIRKNALAKGLIDEWEFTALTLKEIDKRSKARERAGKAIATIYTTAFDKSIAAVTDFNKSAKEKMVDLFRTVIETIAREIIARGTALIAASVFPPNPAGFVAGSGMIAAGATVRSIGSQAKFRQGTDFSPGGTALVGEAGPELVRLPQGSQVTPNNTVNNESIDNSVYNINVQPVNYADFVNELQMTHGVNAFEGG